MVSDALLAEQRRQLLRRLTDSYEVLRDTRTDTDEGGWTNTEAVVGTGACRLRPLGESAQETIIAERLQWQVAYSIDLPHDASLTPRDRLRVNATRTFEIGGIAQGGRDRWKQTVVCREIGS